MTKLQKIFIISGGTILLILSSILIFMYVNAPQQDELLSTMNSKEQPAADEEVSRRNTESINITSNEEEDQETTVGLNHVEDEELQTLIKEALNNIELTETLTEPSEQSFFEHAQLYQYVTSLVGDRLSENEDMEEEAEWVAKEHQAWIHIAEEKTAFNYSEDDFITFVEKENYLENDDLQTISLLNELKNISTNLYTRHLEYHYIKPYIWSNVQEFLQEEHTQIAEETDEAYLFRLYSLFENEVTEYLIENYPQLLQE